MCKYRVSWTRSGRDSVLANLGISGTCAYLEWEKWVSRTRACLKSRRPRVSDSHALPWQEESLLTSHRLQSACVFVSLV